ncbi:MAG TPA: hypothetical protein VM534_01775 [Thermoanaerobaculia bacterium]|nr:hypothetical protein [Thermoanaerobaculia bacterium]
MSRSRSLISLCLLTLLVSSPLHAGLAGTELYLPAVGRVEGSGGSQFYTTLWVSNPSTTATVDFTLQYLAAGQANMSPLSYSDQLAPGETKNYENFAETVFGLFNVLGGARLIASEEVLVGARIYNLFPNQPERNSQGLFFAGVPSGFAIAAGETSLLQGCPPE